jgi:hypothetical protein
MESVKDILLVIALFLGLRATVIKNKKDGAIAAQEEVKIKTEEANLTVIVQSVYQGLIGEFKERLQKVESTNLDLTAKYNDILLRNSVLEERSESYEVKYNSIEKDYLKIKTDYDKILKENKELRKEINILKKGHI